MALWNPNEKCIIQSVLDYVTCDILQKLFILWIIMSFAFMHSSESLLPVQRLEAQAKQLERVGQTASSAGLMLLSSSLRLTFLQQKEWGLFGSSIILIICLLEYDWRSSYSYFDLGNNGKEHSYLDIYYLYLYYAKEYIPSNLYSL